MEGTDEFRDTDVLPVQHVTVRGLPLGLAESAPMETTTTIAMTMRIITPSDSASFLDNDTLKGASTQWDYLKLRNRKIVLQDRTACSTDNHQGS